jgi:hypothetical protein
VPTVGAHASPSDGFRTPRGRELEAQAVRSLGANAQVGADGGDPVVIAQGRTGFPAVANVLVRQSRVWAIVGGFASLAG